LKRFDPKEITMKNYRMAAFAAATALATMPRSVHAAPRADAADPAKVLNDLKAAFEEFKKTNDEKLKAKADVVLDEKVERINSAMSEYQKAIDDLNSKLAASRLGGGGKVTDPAAAAHSKAFDGFFRKGADAGLHDLEVKAGLRTSSDPDGGYLVPEEMETTVDRIAGTVSVMRQLATVMPIGTSTYKKLVGLGGAGAGWVGEAQARPETSTPTLAELAFNVMEIYANPAATQTMLDDARVDIAVWLGNEVSITFAEQEGSAFIGGDGTLKPRGVLAYDTVANASYTWGKLGYTASGVAGALTDGSNNGTDKLIDLYYSLKAPYRNGASFLMSDQVMGTVRKFKDGDGNYIWAPPTAAAEMATVLGKPVYNDDNMPAVGANAFPIAFGNFKRGYLIVDRFGIRVLRDPYTNKPWVHFYTTKRVGGGVSNFEAIKLMKVATS
jgi:HK97 family phage major capsid protein